MCTFLFNLPCYGIVPHAEILEITMLSTPIATEIVSELRYIKYIHKYTRCQLHYTLDN